MITYDINGITTEILASEKECTNICDEYDRKYKKDRKFAEWLMKHFNLKDKNGNPLDRYGYLEKAAELKLYGKVILGSVGLGICWDAIDSRVAHIQDNGETRMMLGYWVGAGAALIGAIGGLKKTQITQDFHNWDMFRSEIDDMKIEHIGEEDT